MKTLKESLSHIRQTVRTTNLAWKFIFAFEVIVIIVISVAANNFTVIDHKSISFWALITFGLFYILIKIFFFTFNQQISETPIDELEAKCELEKVKNRLNRQDSINKTVSQSLHMLNDRTCFLTSDDYIEERATRICEQNLKDGLTELLKPLMKNIPIIFNTNSLKYTLGIFVERFFHIDSENQLECNDHIVVLNDDFGVEANISAQLYSQKNISGISLEIQSVITKSFNNNKYVKELITIDNKQLTMLSSIIPCVCSGEGQDGVLFIIYEPIELEISDIKSTLDIFNRIITNWLSLFKECVFKKNGIYEA